MKQVCIFIIGFIISTEAISQYTMDSKAVLDTLNSLFHERNISTSMIHNFLGTPNDTISINHFKIPGYKQFGVYFFSGNIGFYDSYIIDLKSIKKDYINKPLYIKKGANMALLLNDMASPGRIDLILKDERRKIKEDRLSMKTVDEAISIISTPLSKKNLSELTSISKGKDYFEPNEFKEVLNIAKSISADYIWCSFSPEIMPQIEEIRSTEEVIFDE